MIFKKRATSKIFGAKRDEVTGERKKLYNEVLYALYSSSKYYSGEKTEKNEMGGACGTYGGRDR